MDDLNAHMKFILKEMSLLREKMQVSEKILAAVNREHLELKAKFDTYDEMARATALQYFDQTGDSNPNEYIQIRRLHKPVVDEESSFESALKGCEDSLLEISDGKKAVRMLLEHLGEDELRTVLKLDLSSAKDALRKEESNFVTGQIVVEYTVAVSKKLDALLSSSQE